MTVLDNNNKSSKIRASSSLQDVFLQALGLIFLVANISYYVQYPGLLSSSAGIEPVDRVLPKLFPSLQKLLLVWQIDEDSFVDTLVLFNIFVSSLVVACGIVHCSIFLFLTLSYWVLALLGGVFYSFQWELLLLEVGAITTVCYAPTLTLRPSHTSTSSDIGVWPLRFLLFKLMFMSGVVKLQADCPTWNQLTALEYHYASQPLPGPLAWNAHQFHPFFHRLSVAATLIIEIPMTFLLLAPSSTVRRFGALWQIVLQLLIMLTGNYNFFNLLTIILCLPCLKLDDNYWTSPDGNDDEKIIVPKKKMRRSTTTAILYLFCFLFTAFTARKMFHLNTGSPPSVTLTFTKEQCSDMIAKTIPIAICSTLVILIAHVGLRVRRIIIQPPVGNNTLFKNRNKQIFSLLIRGIVCAICIGLTAVPFLFLSPDLQRSGFIGSKTFIPLWFKVQQYQISNNYGLFRRMTGVGRQPLANDSSNWGWGGLPPSVVAKPEIVLEGVFVTNDDKPDKSHQQINHDEQEEWREIKFRWKPGGDLTQRPRQVAPHQPRLDWQMWFAALGGYRHNPWLIHFVSKLLDGCSPVVQLIDEPQLASGETKLLKIRATLWDYDFTRLPTQWNKRIPNVTFSFTDYDYFWRDIFRQPPQYWTRSNPREYLPPIQKGQADDYLIHHTFMIRTPQNPTGKVCYYGRDRCYHLHKRRFFFCTVAETARKYRAEFFIPILVFILVQLFSFFITKTQLQPIQPDKKEKQQ